MNPRLPTAASLFLLTCLTACGGGSDDQKSEGGVLPVPPPTTDSGGDSGGDGGEQPVTAVILSENFGDGLFVNFDEADTISFFSSGYKALSTDNPDDSHPALYYPTCCFFEGDDPALGTAVNLEQLGIVSDAGNPSLLLNTGRFSLGQSRPALDGADPKKDSTSADAAGTWGELNLSADYRISFCVKEASGSRNMQVFVDNNTSSESKSYWGGGSAGSRIFNVPVNQLVAGKRVEINVPGNVTLEPGATPVDIRPVLVGNASSFLQLRVEGGSTVIIDDLLVEPQTENGQADLPECGVFTPATAPAVPDAPNLNAGDGQITVSWSTGVGVASYDLAWGTSNDISTATQMPAVSSPVLLDSLANGTDYFVFLRANNSAGSSDWSPAASATPVAPLGCVVTSPGDITGSIAWSVYDGCISPDSSGALVLNANSTGSLTYADTDILFSANNDGTATLDTSADGAARSKGDLTGVVADADGYPQYFTLLARVDVSASPARGLEVETAFAAPSDQRVKVLLRPDQGTDGRLQLERFVDGTATAEADLTMADDYHIYQINYIVKDPADGSVVDGKNISASVYRDGVNVSDQFGGMPGDLQVLGAGRTGGGGANRLRIGEDASSGYFAKVDWLLWSNDAAVAAMSADDLVGELPASIGELGFYTGAGVPALLSENFDAATAGDGSTSDFFTAGYKSISGDAGKAFYNVTASGTRITLAGGQLSFNNARFSIGDTDPGVATTAGSMPQGDLDLSQPYVISFDVTANGNDGSSTGKCQVYVDNNTSGSSNSMHGGSSKIFEKAVNTISDADGATGSVSIASSLGTANSFIQLRCDSGVTAPIAIDNFRIERQ